MQMVQVDPVTAPTPELRALVEGLDATLNPLYPPEQRHGLDFEAIFQPHVRFFVARSAGVPVGCGGVALCPTFAEVKRMFVVPSARGSGAAQALLARIEDEARAAGLSLLTLETGTRSEAALRAYEKWGLTRCDAFGDYVGMPVHALATSVFMRKAIA